MNPARNSDSLRIASLLWVNKSGEKTQPCHTALSIFFSLQNSFLSERRRFFSYYCIIPSNGRSDCSKIQLQNGNTLKGIGI